MATNPAQVYLDVRDLSKKPVGGGVTSPLSFVVGAGEWVLIEGPNGSGKSTLLRMMAGVTRPSTGRVERNASIGYLPHPFDPPSQLPVLGYLIQMARMKGLGVREARDGAGRMIDRLELSEFRSSHLGTLSSGNLRRVGVAQALVGAPDVALLDEPSNGLDARGQLLLHRLLEDFCSAGHAVVLADHLRFGPPARELSVRGRTTASSFESRTDASFEIILGGNLPQGALAEVDVDDFGDGRLVARSEAAQRAVLAVALARGVTVLSVSRRSGSG